MAATLQMAIDARGILAEAKKIESAFEGIQKSATKTFNIVKKSADIALAPLKAIITVSATVKAAMLAINTLAIKNAMEQESAEFALRAAIQGNIDAYKDYANTIQQTTKYGDEEILNQLAYAKNLGVTTDKLTEAATAAIGLSARYRIDLSSAMQLVGRASKGQTEMLTRYGIVLDDSLTPQAKFNALLKIGAESFRLARSEIETTSGKYQLLKNVIGEVFEELGTGQLNPAKVVLDDLIAGANALKDHAAEAGQRFGREILIARAYILSVLDTSVKVAQQIRESMKVEGGFGQSLLTIFETGVSIFGKGILSAFDLSLTIWKDIGKMIGTGLMQVIYESDIPGAGFARKSAIKQVLGQSDLEKLTQMAKELDVTLTTVNYRIESILSGSSGSGAGIGTGFIPDGVRLKTAKELIDDIAGSINNLSITEQAAFIGEHPFGKAFELDVQELQKKFGSELTEFKDYAIQQLQQTENDIAKITGQQPVDLLGDVQANVKLRLDEAETTIKNWQAKNQIEFNWDGAAALGMSNGNNEAAQKLAEQRAEITARMYEDMGIKDNRYRKSQKALLDIQRQDFEKILNDETTTYDQFVKNKALLDDWYAARLEKLNQNAIDTWTEQYSATNIGDRMAEGYAQGLDTLASTLSEFERTGKAEWDSWCTGLLITWQETANKMALAEFQANIIKPAYDWASAGVNAFVSSLFKSSSTNSASGGSGGVDMSMTGGGGSYSSFSGLKNANGNVFNRGRVVPMANGDVFDRPTYFPMDDGNTGLVGEGGLEAAMPLKRMSNGRLGVHATQPNITVNPTPVKVVLVDDKRQATIEILKSNEGEKVIVQQAVRNKRLLR